MEIRALKSFNNESIPYLYGVYTSDNYIVLQQEYIPGTTLRVFLSENKIAVEDCFQICWKLLQIVYLIQTKGFCHRDIKPTNIMIEKREFLVPKQEEHEVVSNEGFLSCSWFQRNNSTNCKDVKLKNAKYCYKKYDYKITLVDFGLCISYDDQNMRDCLMTKICGTRGYFAPEIILANTPYMLERLDMKKVDIFAIGIILYEMIVGKNPFYGNDSSLTLNSNKICNIDYSHACIRELNHDQKGL